jgi:tetratricopeptide (TPR) repeat protein
MAERAGVGWSQRARCSRRAFFGGGLLGVWDFFLVVAGCARPDQGRVPALDAKAIAANNRGVGLMGRFDYEAARRVFQELAGRHPDWLDVQVNLAVATLNRQEEGDVDAAMAILARVLKRDPTHTRAHYVEGLLWLYRGAPDKALPDFQAVTDADRADAYAAYYRALCLGNLGRFEEALIGYRTAAGLDPYLRSASYGLFQSAQRLGRREDAAEALATYQRLDKNPRSRLAEFKYTRMGPKGAAFAADLPPPKPPPVPAPQGPVFADGELLALTAPAALRWRTVPPDRAASITAGDLGGDGRAVFIPEALSSPHAPNAVLLRKEAGAFTFDLTHPLARVGGVNTALWGDYDNDGLVDVYLLRRGPNQLWRQVAPGRWQDVTAKTKAAGGNVNHVDGAFFDADHTGALDLFLVSADGPNELLINTGNGTFQAAGRERGVAGDGRPSRSVVLAALDGGRDVHLIVLKETPPHEVYHPDRLGKYLPASGFDDFQATPLVAAVAGDVNAEGTTELYGLTPAGEVLRWRPDTTGRWQRVRLGRIDGPSTSSARMRLALLDVDGSGVPDLVVSNSAGWTAYRFAGNRRDTLAPLFTSAGATLAGWLPVILDPARGPALLGFEAGGGLRLWAPGPGRHRFLGLAVSGKQSAAESLRSNASGIGTRISVRVDSRWTSVNTFRAHSGPGQDLQPIAVGLGGADRADFIALDWPDGVFQTELDVTAGQLHRVAETQRQLSSCPVLFAWDGERYAFVTDVLGVGGIGYATAPGEYLTPRPWENLQLPAGLLEAKDGTYRLKLTEPMEEATYLDAARLVHYDLPPGWQLVLDERMQVGEPAPTGEPRFYRQTVVPVEAIDEPGQVVTELITKADRRPAPVGPKDPRFIGLLAEEHVLTLRFSEPLDAHDGAPVLIMDGWIEYPYGQTMVAAWKAGARYLAPTLEARGGDGRWRTVWKEFGYPAGMPRRASVPLTGLPPGTTELRLRTTQEIYWDYLVVAYAEPLSGIQRRELPLRQAVLSQPGFPLRTTEAHRLPSYDYSRRRPFWDTWYQAGLYTRFGPVEELVAAVDDAVAIIGPGDEVHLEFAVPDVPLAPGWTRTFVLELNGWAKDMDLFTRDGETIDPLPTRSGTSDAGRDALHARYNTRYQSGR